MTPDRSVDAEIADRVDVDVDAQAQARLATIAARLDRLQRPAIAPPEPEPPDRTAGVEL